MKPREFDWDKYYTRVSDRSLYFARIWTSIDVIADIINELFLFSETASKINSSLSDGDAATLFDYADLLVAQACGIWDNSNLSDSKLIAILDHPNITSARIKAIFQVGCIVLSSRIACILEGDQHSAADAALSVNGSYYTLTQLAGAFGHVNLTDAKSASIFDSSNLLVAKAASIFNHANLTDVKLISILDHANITSARIKAIFETGSLSVDAKRAATLEGNQYTAANAATSINLFVYSEALTAAAFNHVNLTPEKVAAICDHSNLLPYSVSLIFDEANFTAARGDVILAEDNFTVAKIASSLSHGNLAAAKAAAMTDLATLTATKLKDVFLHVNLSESKRVSIAWAWSRLGGKTPSAPGSWTSAPGSLTDITDANSASTCTAGNVYAAATQEKLAYVFVDIGSLQDVKVITVKYAGHKVGSGSHEYHIKLQHSANGSDWTDIVDSLSADSSYVIDANIRYIRFEVWAKGGAISGEVTVYLDSCHFCLC